MFVHDGQFGFSLFRLATAALVQCLGLAARRENLAILAAFAWFFGIRAFAQQFASGATVWVAVIFTVLLPNVYGAPYPFGFAELIAIPRPSAEALVFAGLARLPQDGMLSRFCTLWRRPCFIRSWRWPDWESWLPSAVWKTSAGFGFALSVVLC